MYRVAEKISFLLKSFLNDYFPLYNIYNQCTTLHKYLPVYIDASLSLKNMDTGHYFA